MNKKLLSVVAFSTLLAGSLAVGGIVACNGGAEEEEKETCSSNADCKVGQVCNQNTKTCETIQGCDQADENACGEGKYCNSLGECAQCGSAAASCVVLGTNGQASTDITIGAGKTMQLQAVALDVNGSPIYCADFAFKAGSKDVADGKYTAAAGDTKITATVNGGSATCTANVNVIADEDAMLSVFVYDDNTGAAVADAKVVLNDASSDFVTTDENGVAKLETLDGASKYTVSVFKEGYIYATVAGLDSSNTNIAIPVGARPVKGIATGGTKGKLSFTNFAQWLKDGVEQDFRVAFMLNSIPLSTIFSADVENFIGEMASMSTCRNDASAKGCYALGDLIPDSLMGVLGSVQLPDALPLPGGLVVSAKTGDMKTSYAAPAVPGKRIPWGIGFEFTISDITGLANVATPLMEGDFDLSKLDLSQISSSVLPFLFGKFGSVVGTVADTPATDSESSWTNQDVSMDEKMRIYREVKIASLPTDARTNKQMDAVGAIRLSNAKGFGAVVTGIAVNADLDQDGTIDAATVCSNTAKVPDCPEGVSGSVAAGNLGMLYAPAHGAIKNADDMTIYITAPISEAMAGLDNGGEVDYGDIRIFGNIKHSAPAKGDSIKADDFIGIPATDVKTKADTYTFTQATGADMNIIMLAGDVVDGNVSNRWMVYSADDDVVLPKVPAGMADPTGDEAHNKTVAHISAKLSTGASFDNLVSNNGQNVDSVFENIDSFSVFVPEIYIYLDN